MPVQTRTITATISDFDGQALKGARVIIKLVGLGNEPQGAVSPGTKEAITNASGVATFTLWENRLDYSDTYYEISSYHPVTGQAIHQREQFLVFDSNADVKDLIGLDLAGIDPTQALLNQIAQDKISAANSASAALGYKNSAQSSAATAASGASTATTQAGIATAQAVIATAQAGISTTQAGIATGAASSAQTNANTIAVQVPAVLSAADSAADNATLAYNARVEAVTKANIATVQAGIASDAANSILGAVEEATGAATVATSEKDLAVAAREAAEDARDETLVALEGAYAGTVVSVNGKTGSMIALVPADLGAATSAQGALADSALQPGALASYATTTDLNKTRKIALAAI